MKTARRKNMAKTAAFVSALLIAFSGMAGVTANTGIDRMMSVSAADSATSGITVSGELFGLGTGDNAILYHVHRNEYGNEATTALTSIIAATDETLNLTLNSENEGLYVKRFRRIGTADGVKTDIDYFYLVSSGSTTKWVYAGADEWELLAEDRANKFSTGGWSTSADACIISATKEEFELSTYDVPEGIGVKQDTVQIYSTTLDAAGESVYVGTLSGDDASDLSLLVSKSKNTGYIAVRTVGGVQTSTSKLLETDRMYRYDMESGQWVLFYDSYADKGEGKSFNTLTLFPKAKTFPMLADKNVQELRIYRTVDGVRTLIQTFDKKTFDGGWGAVTQKFDNDTMGFCYATTYGEYSWEADVYEEFTSNYIKVHDAKCISGKFLANIPYATSTAETSSEKVVLTDFIENLTPSETASGMKSLPVLPESTVSDTPQTRPVYLRDEFSELEKGNHGNVYLYENTDVIVSYTANEFDSGCFSIPKFDSYSNYFLKVEHAEDDENTLNDYYTMYKWDEEAGKWRFRVNTEETPVASVPVTHAEFTPFLTGDYDVNLNLVTGKGDKKVSTTISSWTKEDFDKGTINAALALLNAGEYEIEFVNGENASLKKQHYGKVTYRYVGIDPVFVDGEITIKNDLIGGQSCPSLPEFVALENTASIAPITNAKADDVISVDGTAPDGNQVHYEVTVSVDNGTVRLPEGDFTVTDTTAGYKADVEVGKEDDDSLYAVVTDKSSVDDRYVNVTKPVEINAYTVTSPDGTVIDEGTMKGSTLKASDLSLSANQLKAKTNYAGFHAESGIVNAADDESLSIEDGYLTVADSKINKVFPESTVKGDINFDGKTTVTDVIMLQKYLHGKTSYKAENFINADMNNDGEVNIFDLSLLKRNLLK